MRSISREREMAMRAALGAGHLRLARQCLTESAVLGFFGGVPGILLAAFGLRPFVALWPGGLPRAEEIHPDWRVLAFAGAISLLCGFLFGAAPAFRIRLDRLEENLRGAQAVGWPLCAVRKSGARSIAGGSRRLNGVFVACEMALALVLLVSAGTLGRAMLRLASLDPGLNTHNVLTARIALPPRVLTNPDRIRPAWRDVLERARELPDVESAALTDIVPMREGENSLAYRTTALAPSPNEEPLALASSVTSDYLKVMGIPLRAGRFFTENR